MTSVSRGKQCLFVGKLWLVTLLFVAPHQIAAQAQNEDSKVVAESLAALLSAGMAVISTHQDRINDASLGDKGLDGKRVLAEAVKLYIQQTGRNPSDIAATSLHGKLIRVQMDAVAEVMNEAQTTINAKGVGFKGFIPSVFARLVNDEFSKRASGQAEMKITAPPNLVRNRRMRPDAWEADIIASKFLAPGWPKAQAFTATVDEQGKTAFRMLVPGYYEQSCLSCHGSPKGQLDITGYPKEGGLLDQLGTVISLKLYQ